MNNERQFTILSAVLLLLLAACVTDGEPAAEIQWSPEWFQCDGRFDCTAVYDAYCKYTGVNTNYLRIYQDWAHQQVHKSGEILFCEPVGDDKPLAAYCRNKICEYP